MKVGEFEIEINRKKIKNIHLAVLPPTAKVRISVPWHYSDKATREYLESKLPWIREAVKKIKATVSKNYREFVSGEIHNLFGKDYTLQIIHSKETPSITITSNEVIMKCYPKMDKNERAAFLFNFYKNELTKQLEPLLVKWLNRMKEDGLKVEYGIDNMPRQWGKCYPMRRKIVFNLFLARVPLECIEYVVVHELNHLKIHGHGKDFKSRMDYFLPDWKIRRKSLNDFPSLSLTS